MTMCRNSIYQTIQALLNLDHCSFKERNNQIATSREKILFLEKHELYIYRKWVKTFLISQVRFHTHQNDKTIKKKVFITWLALQGKFTEMCYFQGYFNPHCLRFSPRKKVQCSHGLTLYKKQDFIIALDQDSFR